MTSELLKHRVDACVPPRITALKEAIGVRNFPKFAEICMRESNQLHAVCVDTFPPLLYLSDSSRRIIRLCHAYNEHHLALKVAYTFDAGPNSVLFMEERVLGDFLPYLCHYFPNTEEEKFIRGPIQVEPSMKRLRPELLDVFDPIPNGIEYLVITDVGDGPAVVV